MNRVLHVVNSMGVGGIETFLMNVYRKIDRDNLQFDFLLHKKTNSHYEKEIISLGGKIFYLPTRREGIIESKRALNEFFDLHSEYHIVHEHVSSLSDIDALICAHKHGVNGRIIHAHSTAAPGSRIHKYLHKMNQKKLKKAANYYFSCSDASTRWLYSGTGVIDKVKFIPNGVDCQRFCFDQTIRDNYRNKLSLSNKKVIIHIGRLSTEKNHMFLIDAFDYYHKNNPESLLLLIGDGILKSQIQELIYKKNLSESIIMLGVRKDIPELLMASDLFVLPSLFEGFPVSIIEAQSTGIPCLYSNNITATAKVLENVKQLDINKGSIIWSDEFENMIKLGRFKNAYNEMSASKFNIDNVTRTLSEFYQSVIYGDIVNE